MIHPHCVLGNKNHSRFSWMQQFIYSVSSQLMFQPNGHRQVGRHGRLNTKFWMEMDSSVSYIYIYYMKQS